MIERNKKLIIALSVYFILTFLLPLPFVLIFDRIDIMGISSIISTLLILLFINGRTGLNLKYRFKEEYLSKKKKEQKISYIEEQRILWIFFLIMLIITFIVCCVFF